MYTYLMLTKDKRTRKEREESVLELVNNDPDIECISMKREARREGERGEETEDEEESEGRERKWDVLKGAEKAKFWKVCEWFYLKQKEFNKVHLIESPV